ncbi:Uu.00g071410.m01.CDS01 [Anthostomella pinea]|uniref:Uu.00g071410.m01.CDS01 n=1 Tax=Anthostomella pinea TaxID=933095 RepID=A0AAI8VP91_9PEZI|nr:Uu.00g071410.m01.CDS01 [Anthostomella pinea]
MVSLRKLAFTLLAYTATPALSTPIAHPRDLPTTLTTRFTPFNVGHVDQVGGKKFTNFNNQPIGTGGAAHIYEGVMDGQRVVIKICRQEPNGDQHYLELCRGEITVMKELEGILEGHAPKLLAHDDNGSQVRIVMNRAEGGDLFDATSDGYAKSLDGKSRRKIAKDILGIVTKLHAEGWAYRDLSLENIMFADANKADGTLWLIDPAWAIDGESKFSGGVTEHYLAPELIASREGEKSEPIDQRPADVYAVGIDMLIFVCGINMNFFTSKGYFPLNLSTKDRQQKLQSILGKYYKLVGNKDLLNLLAQMIEPNPANRITAKDALNKVQNLKDYDFNL